MAEADLPDTPRPGNRLGDYLKDRRARLDPAALGFPLGRRRTPGLRREEVAQRANISATWYTWLEQGRGGAASADVLDRIARALNLSEVEREHLFLIGLGHPPEVRYQDQAVTPRLQRVVDALDPSPALIRTATWDVVAWNRGVAAMLTDYGALAPDERNILRSLFLDPRARAMQPHWESVARYVIGSFRADIARVGADRKVQPLIDELRRRSPEFADLWREQDIPTHNEGTKTIQHPVIGALQFEYSAFAVDGQPGLTLVVYNPATPADRAKIEALLT